MEKIWFKNYQKGVPHAINDHDYSSLVHLFEESCQKYAQNTAYTNLNFDLTYQKLNQYSLALAAYLQHLNLKPARNLGYILHSAYRTF